MKLARATALLSLFAVSAAMADDTAPANSELVVDESFDHSSADGKLGKGWKATTGNWVITNGVLRASEIADEKHSAAARRLVETQNAVYQLRFRFVEDGKTFHFGFDPKRGELKKRGHLFSVVVTRSSWQLLKHVDKDRREDDPNEVLAEWDTDFTKDTWYTLRVTTWGTFVTARIEGKENLRASHPTFNVKKPTLVFRCLGDGVEIDNVKVWRQK